MAEAGEKPIPSEAPIPISEAAARVLKFYPAHKAGPLMRQGLADGRIHCSYRELVGHRASEPTPDKPGFWKPDPRGQTQLTRFPWPGDWARRRVQPGWRGGRKRALCDYTALGLAVTWAEVVKIFPGAAAWAADGKAPPRQPDYRLPKETKITAQAIIGVIVDCDLYLDGLPSEIAPGTLRRQCNGAWEAACKANSVKLPLPAWPTFKTFIKSRRGRTSIEFD
jgi:hypothetical protein